MTQAPQDKGFAVQGWCPSSWRPMRAQDGWLVRVRPVCASIRVEQWQRLAELAQAHAHPQLELTRLGNVQLRGVADHALPALRAALIEAQLVPADPELDDTPAVLCSPFHEAGDATHQLALAVRQAVQHGCRPSFLAKNSIPALPSKFSVLVDDEQRSLRQVVADLRLWPAGAQSVTLARGEHELTFAHRDDAVAAALALATCFAADRLQLQPVPTRLAQWLRQEGAHLDAAWSGAAQPAPVAVATPSQDAQAPGAPSPGRHSAGWLLGVPLGRIDLPALRALCQQLPAQAELRVTPWRALYLPAAQAPAQLNLGDAWISTAQDARLRVSACTGAPRCAQGHAPTQPLALQLAKRVPAGVHVHVSGCAKHCALPAEADALLEAQPAPAEAAPHTTNTARWQARLLNTHSDLSPAALDHLMRTTTHAA